MNNRGQFFFVAALVLASIIIGFGTTYIATNSVKEDMKVFDLSKEMSYEGAKVIDYGIFNSIDKDELNKSINDLIDYYANLNPDKDIALIYGDSSFYFTCDPQGSTSAGSSRLPVCKTYVQNSNIEKNNFKNKITIFLSSNRHQNYSFDLKKDQNFYLVVIKEKGTEKIVATN